jgi:hypothetical protein
MLWIDLSKIISVSSRKKMVPVYSQEVSSFCVICIGVICKKLLWF